MRRKFNASLCPKEAPKKGKVFKGSPLGSPFNRWFRSKLKETKITMKEFSILCDIPYQTISTWRYKNDPRILGQCRIARAFESLEMGDYKEIMRDMRQHLRYWR